MRINKVYRDGRPQRESTSPYKVSARDGEAVIRIQFRYASLAKRVRREDEIKIRSTEMVDLIFMAPATGIEPITNP